MPLVKKVKLPPLVIVHTPVVVELKVGIKPESEVALNVGVVPKFCEPGLAKVMVCTALGVTLFDAAEDAPMPTPLVAVTVKVYATPLVKPVTVIGDAAPDAFAPPGKAVAV